MNRSLSLAIGFLALTGCYHIKYTTHTEPAATAALDEWHHNWVFGLVEGSAPVKVNEACSKSGFSVAESNVSFGNGALDTLVNAVVGVELWSPSTVKVTCSVRPPAAGVAAGANGGSFSSIPASYVIGK